VAAAARAERKVATVHALPRTAVWIVSVVAAVSVPACTSTRQVETVSESRPVVEDTCFSLRDVASFSPLHGRFVYVRLVRGQQYLLTLDNIYTSLPYATGVAISGTFDRVCSDAGAVLSFSDFGRRVSARIVRVEAVNSKETAQALVDDRTPH
jgi:hypothetical protein